MPIKVSMEEYQRRVDKVKTHLDEGASELLACKRANIAVGQYRYALSRINGKKEYKRVQPSDRANDLEFTMRTTPGKKERKDHGKEARARTYATRATSPATKTLAQELRSLADKVERVTEAFKAI